MIASPNVESSRIVIDASMAVALCAKEPRKYVAACAKMEEYTKNGVSFYVPGVFVAECLFVLCRKAAHGDLTAAEHREAIDSLRDIVASTENWPDGDRALIRRAEEIRAGRGCSHSADGLYLALAEALAGDFAVEVVTFDRGMQTQAQTANVAVPVVVLPVAKPDAETPPG